MASTYKVSWLMRKKLFSTVLAWFHWRGFSKAHKFNTQHQNTAVVVIPAGNDEVDYYALVYLDQLLKKRGDNKAIIITDNPIIEKVGPIFSKKIIEVDVVTKKRIDQYLQYRRVVDFSRRLVIASLTEPYGRNVLPLVGVHGTSAEELFALGVYGVKPLYYRVPTTYYGNDSEIHQYLEKIKSYGSLSVDIDL